MQRERIDVLEVRRITEVRELKEAFELRRDRPALWLQRACLWVLRKLKAFASTEFVRIERHQIGPHGDSFMARLWKAKEAVWGKFDLRPQRLLLGPLKPPSSAAETKGGA